MFYLSGEYHSTELVPIFQKSAWDFEFAVILFVQAVRLCVIYYIIYNIGHSTYKPLFYKKGSHFILLSVEDVAFCNNIEIEIESRKNSLNK